MYYKKEIIGFLIIFIITYCIIYLDKKINDPKCQKCSTSQTVSFKVPFIVSIGLLGIYKFSESYINDYLNSYTNCIIRQDIITEMADF
jgi:hypothetical protein